MAAEITLDQVVTRLRVLEETVHEIRSQLKEQAASANASNFEFVVYANGQEVWHGQELDANYAELRRQYPDAQLTIGWRAVPFILV